MAGFDFDDFEDAFAEGDLVEVVGEDGRRMGIIMGFIESEGYYEVGITADLIRVRVKAKHMRKVDDPEKVETIQKEIAAGYARANLAPTCDYFFGNSSNYLQYLKKLSGVLNHVTRAACAQYLIDDSWIAVKQNEYADEPYVKSATDKANAAKSLEKLGTAGLEKYSACEVIAADAPKRSATVVVVLGWDATLGRYHVAAVDNLQETFMVKKNGLKQIPWQQFVSKEDAYKLQVKLDETYKATPALMETIQRLKSSGLNRMEYAAKLAPQLLQYEKPVLRELGFRDDIAGREQARWALAPYLAEDPSFEEREAALKELIGLGQIRYDGRVAIVTGSGRGLGRAFAKLLAVRGAKVVINNRTASRADDAVRELTALGCTAVADYSDVGSNGKAAFETAMKAFGRCDIIVCNAGQLEDRRFEMLQVDQFTSLLNTHLIGHVALIKEAWSQFVQNKYGRVVIIASTSGLWGNMGQSNYGAVKMALASVGQTMAYEGYEHNITVNIHCPEGLTQMTNDLRPPEFRVSEQRLLEMPQPTAVPVALMCHESNTTTGCVHRCADAHIQSFRFQCDEDFVDFDPRSPETALEDCNAKWKEPPSFEKVSYPGRAKLAKFCGVPPPVEDTVPEREVINLGKGAPKVRYDERVAIVLNAGAGLGKQVAVALGLRGAKVIVNDTRWTKADDVVAQIKQAGGTAIADYHDMELEPEKVVNTALDEFEVVHIFVLTMEPPPSDNNSPVDKMTAEDFESVIQSHFVNPLRVIKKAWPSFFDDNFGRLVLCVDEAGFHGAIGKASYGAACGAFIGMGQILAMEGGQYGIKTNMIAVDDTPGCVGPVCYLCSEGCKSTKGLFRVSAGHVTALRWQSDESFVDFDADEAHGPALEACAAIWPKVPRWEKVDYFASPSFWKEMAWANAM